MYIHSNHTIQNQTAKSPAIPSKDFSIPVLIDLYSLQNMETKHLSFLLMVLFFVQETSGQVGTQCAQQLLPCINYLNGTSDPPSSCCDPLKNLIKYQPECLCSMISTKGANQAERAGINLADAQQLPGRCGQHVNPLGCILGAPKSNSTSFSFQDGGIILAAAASGVIIQVLWTLLF